MPTPKVFISYSHDSQEHKDWVIDLARELMASGIDTILDQWELSAGDDLPHFMEKAVSSSKQVLMVCTEQYVKKANSGKGGVGYEKMLATSGLLSTINSKTVLPLIRQKHSRELPTFLKSKIYIDFSNDSKYGNSVDELIRAIHEISPQKPALGKNPFESTNTKPIRNGDFPELSANKLNGLKREIYRQVFKLRKATIKIEEENRATFEQFMIDVNDGYINKEHVIDFFKQFNQLDSIYFQNEMLFDKDIREVINESRFFVVNTVNELGALKNNETRLKRVAPDGLESRLFDIDFITKFASYPSTIREAILKQMDRLKKLNGIEEYLYRDLIIAKEELLNIEWPLSPEIEEDYPINQEEWLSLIDRFKLTDDTFRINSALLDTELRNRVESYLEKISEYSLDTTTIKSAELIIKYTEFVIDVFDEQIDRLKE